MNIVAVYSYQERWRDVPDEARQPSIQLKWCQFTQSVCFGRWEKGSFYNTFLPCVERYFYFSEIIESF